MGRKWHVEHEDGRPWTPIELARVYRCLTARFVLTEEGYLGVLYEMGHVPGNEGRDDLTIMDWDVPEIDTRNMVVVFDD